MNFILMLQFGGKKNDIDDFINKEINKIGPKNGEGDN